MSGILTVLAVSLIYSGGMPILYPIAGTFFFFTYWTDKCLLLKYSRKPIKFDNYMARHSVIYLKYILFGHICGLILMFGLTPILQDSLFDFVPRTIQIFKQKTFSLFPFYFWIVAGLIALYLVWFLLI